MNYDNEMSLMIKSKSSNEGLARVCVASFASPLDPTVGEISDIKVAVSEAVTNAIIHGYLDRPDGEIYLNCKIKDYLLYIEVKDKGHGIQNIQEAMTPLFTSKPENERSGLGFTVMETFMDKVEVTSCVGIGTTVNMVKKISHQ